MKNDHEDRESAASGERVFVRNLVEVVPIPQDDATASVIKKAEQEEDSDRR